MSLASAVRRKLLEAVARGLAGDVNAGKYGEGAKAMWKFLSGKKTWLGALVIGGPELVEAVTKILTDGGAAPSTFARIAGLVLVVVGVLHKLAKGEPVAPDVNTARFGR